MLQVPIHATWPSIETHVGREQTIVPFTVADRCLSFLPLSHVLERMAGLYLMLHCGVGIAYAEGIDTVPQDLLAVRPTIVIWE